MSGSALPKTKDGRPVRPDSEFRDRVEKGGRFPPEAGRYHLYVSRACPWANRTLAFRRMKGLEHVIEVHIVHPTWKRTRPDDPKDTHCGWNFIDENDYVDDFGHTFSKQDCTQDPLHNAKTVRELYDLSVRGEYVGKYTIPILWCSKENVVVSNESAEICRMLNSEFDEFARKPCNVLDLYPNADTDKVKQLEEWIYSGINDGVYQCGFATTQEAYDEAVEKVFSSLDRAEEILSKSRYLCGNKLSGVDIWLFMSLIRFDVVYAIYFKCAKKCVREYPNLWGYTRDLYQIPEIGSTVNISHIKMHYFTSHNKLNPYAIIPSGPDLDYMAPHDRDKKFPI